MGQKINPIGFRLAVNRNWSSRWYANNRSFAPMLAEDIKVRDFLKRKLAHASVGRVLIERPAKDARITIFSARPGVVIGKKGEEIEALKAELRRLMGVNQVHVNIEEIRKPEVDAQLIADSIAQQREKRIMCRRAKKPVPKPGARRPSGRPRPEGERKAAKKPDAPAPKTTVKRPKKVLKDEGGGTKE